MSQKSPPNPKTLGRAPGSLHAPIVAFTMAIILCSYCFSSIRAARREAQVQPAEILGSQRRGPQPDKDSSWIQQALEESQAEKNGKRGKSNG